MTDLVVWGAGTPRAMRVYWALEELGLEYEHHLVTSRSGETQTPEFTALYVIRRHEGLAEVYGESAVAAQAARDYYREYALVASETLTDGRDYILGDTFTGADILLTTTLDWGRMSDIALPEAFDAYLQRTHARPAQERAWALCASARPDGSRVTV